MNDGRLVCRLCLFKGNIIDFIDIFIDNEYFVNAIKDCLSLVITASDSLPKIICHSCVNKINQWSIFKKHTLNSNRILGLLYSKNLKEDEYSENNINTVVIKNDIEANFEVVINDETNEQINSHFQDESLLSNKYICDHCPSEFTALMEYLHHQDDHEKDKSLHFKCEECNEICTSREAMLVHEIEHKRRNKCSICGKSVSRRNMRIHMNKHSDKFKCVLCGLRCNAPSTLAAHKLSVHSNHRQHCCSTCGKRFNTLNTLRTHLATHSGKREYACPITGCTYTARIRAYLHSHMVRKHPKEKNQENGAICVECGKIFKSTRNLGDHMRRTHSKIKKYECQFCDMKFVARHLLTFHVMKHTGERPFRCKICDKSFNRSDSLRNHEATHRNRILYRCHSCGKKFVTKRGHTSHNCTRVK